MFNQANAESADDCIPKKDTGKKGAGRDGKIQDELVHVMYVWGGGDE